MRSFPDSFSGRCASTGVLRFRASLFFFAFCFGASFFLSFSPLPGFFSLLQTIKGNSSPPLFPPRGVRSFPAPQDIRAATLFVERQVVLFHLRADAIERVVHVVGKFQQLVFALADRSGAHHVAPVEDLVPVFPAVNQDHVVRGKLVRLQQREHFPQLVHRSKSAGKHDQRFGHLREPQFAHEKIMEAEIQFFGDVGIGALLVRQLDAEADRRTACIGRAAVCGFHDARAAAGTDDESLGMQAERHRPAGDAAGKFARFFVVARHFHVRLGEANPVCPFGGAAAARARSNFF